MASASQPWRAQLSRRTAQYPDVHSTQQVVDMVFVKVTRRGKLSAVFSFFDENATGGEIPTTKTTLDMCGDRSPGYVELRS